MTCWNAPFYVGMWHYACNCTVRVVYVDFLISHVQLEWVIPVSHRTVACRMLHATDATALASITAQELGASQRSKAMKYSCSFVLRLQKTSKTFCSINSFRRWACQASAFHIRCSAEESLPSPSPRQGRAACEDLWCNFRRCST